MQRVLIDKIFSHLNAVRSLRTVSRGLLRNFALFAALKIANEDWNAGVFSPSAAVDQVWHSLILDTVAYRDFCAAFCNGEMLHHRPDGGSNLLLQQERYIATYLIVSHLAHYKPKYWPKPYTLAIRGGKRTDASFQIFIKLLQGETATFEVEASTTVGALKTLLNDKMYEGKMCPQQMRLLFAAQQLADDKALGSYGIVRESTIQFVLRLGGC